MNSDKTFLQDKSAAQTSNAIEVLQRLQSPIRLTLLVSSLVLLLGTSRSAQGLTVNLEDNGATVSIDVDSQHGLYDWITDGVNIAPVVGAVGGIDDFRQWFWYGVGTNAPASIDSLTRGFTLASNTNPDPSNDTLNVNYTGAPGFTLGVTFSLISSPGRIRISDIGEQITIKNTNTTSMDFHFYQYGDFQLAPPFIGGEHAWFTNTNTVHETGVFGAVQETVITPPSSHREIEPFSTTIDKLNNGTNAVTLDDNNNVFGDVTWTYEWDVTLAPGQSLVISKDMQVTIPEPGSFALVFVGVAGLCLLRRRKMGS